MQATTRLELLFEDVRTGMRLMYRSPGFASLAILILAVGIGANAAIFSLANAAFFRPLPYQDAERLAFLWQSNQRTGQSEGLVSYPNLADWRSQSHTFSDMAFFAPGKSILSENNQDATRTPSALVSVNFFSVLGLRPILGRSFAPGEDVPGRADVVVISYRLWRTRFAGDPAILGRDLVYGGGEKKAIVGVMPAGFNFPDDADLWIPREINQFLQTKARQYPNQRVIGRLNAGMTWGEAQTELNTIAARLAKEYPGIDDEVGVHVVPLRQQLSSKVREGLIVLWCAVVAVLLIACVNVANLFLARSAGRQKEVCVRYSLGATRSRIVRECLTESLLLSVFAAAGGVLLAVWIVSLFSKIDPDISGLGGSVLNVRVLGYTIGVATLTALVCGSMPLLSAPPEDLNRGLRESTSGQPAPGANALRRIFIAVQVSLAFVLLSASGLLIKSLWQIVAVPAGFDADHVLTLHIYWPDAPADATAENQRDALYKTIISRLSALPGVASVGATSNVLFPSEMYKTPFVVEGRPEQSSGQKTLLPNGEATPDYFRTMSIPLVKGRVFTQADSSQDAPPVIVINETVARAYWPDEDPIGHRLRFDDPNFKSPWFTIVGVVGDVRGEGLERPAGLMAYEPTAGYWADDLVLRSASDPRTLISAVRQEIRAVNPHLAIDNVNVVGDLLTLRESRRRLNAWLLGSFAAVALLLATVGIYGTISYWVRQRTAEIGIRMALGADRKNVSSLVVKSGMRFVVVGLMLGVGVTLASAKLIASLLVGVSASDPTILILIGALLLIVAYTACWIPARRAVRIDPMVALRHD